jgi:CubicO group peptidase (beta-lactamase class C family)
MSRFLVLLLAAGLASAAPQESGLAPAKLAELRQKLQEAVDQKQAAGIAWGIGRRGLAPAFDAVGARDLEANAPMKADSIFRIASMTKPVTAIAVLMLEEDGKLSTDDPASKFVPEFGKVSSSRPITLKHLLTHTSGIPGGPPREISDLYQKRHKTLAEAVPAFAREPGFEPGTKWQYCNTGIDALGRVVEVASGKTFEAFLEERLLGPLGMRDTFFYLAPERAGRAAKTYKKDPAGLVPSGGWLGGTEPAKYPLPAGGLWSTAPDLARLCEMLLAGGVREGRRYLKEASIAKMTANHTGDLKAGFTPGIVMGLGFQVVGAPEGVTAMLSPGAYGHGGAFGTQYWIDPKKGMYFILMVQREGFGNGDASDLRKALQSGAVAAVTD